MTRFVAVVLVAVSGAAFAQVQAPQQQLAPNQSPNNQQAQPQNPNAPKKLDTFSDRITRCLHYGAGAGVPADQLAQFSRVCAQGN